MPMLRALCALVLAMGVMAPTGWTEESTERVALLPYQPNAVPAAIPAHAVSAIPSAPSAQPIDSNAFRLGPGDEVQVTVWAYPELSGKTAVLPDGTIATALAGPTSVIGLTPREAAEALQDALAPHLAAPPHISLSLEQMRSRQFSVLGAVNTPGVYPLWTDHVTVLEAVAQAGGLEPSAILAGIEILRARPGEAPRTIPVDWQAMLRDPAGHPAPVMEPGDVVHVPNAMLERRVCILGEVQHPGLYPLTTDMTVIEALSIAGWVKPSAVASSIIVARQHSGGRELFRIDATRSYRGRASSDASAMLLRPGDIVYVPARFLAQLGDVVSFFSSKVEPAARAYLGVYDATNPADVLVDR